jgi:hypothetical protein
MEISGTENKISRLAASSEVDVAGPIPSQPARENSAAINIGRMFFIFGQLRM